MSIREVGEKIKASLQGDRVFFGLILLLTALISFGLGRLSVSMTPISQGSGQKTEEIVQKSVVLASTQIAAPIEGVERASSATTTPGATQDSAPVTEGAYVGSRNSDKYHLPWCPGARRISPQNKVWFATREDAEKAGYSPASNCPGIE